MFELLEPDSLPYEVDYVSKQAIAEAFRSAFNFSNDLGADVLALELLMVLNLSETLQIGPFGLRFFHSRCYLAYCRKICLLYCCREDKFNV